MPTIPLTRGLVAQVSPEDYDRVRQIAWQAQSCRDNPELFYAAANHRGTKLYMHRLITSAPKGFVVDHRDRDRLNNRRGNLRICSYSANRANTGPNALLGLRGVVPVGRRYRARITVAGEELHLGYYCSAEEAARAYDVAAREYYGEYAWLNLSDAEARLAGELAAEAAMRHELNSIPF